MSLRKEPELVLEVQGYCQGNTLDTGYSRFHNNLINQPPHEGLDYNYLKFSLPSKYNQRVHGSFPEVL